MQGPWCLCPSDYVRYLLPCTRTHSGEHLPPRAVEAFVCQTQSSKCENACGSHIRILNQIKICLSIWKRPSGGMHAFFLDKQTCSPKDFCQVFSVTVLGGAMCWLLGQLPVRTREHCCVWLKEESGERAKPRNRTPWRRPFCRTDRWKPDLLLLILRFVPPYR